ncbi:MAG: Pr6Pr family membrane protein [Pseudoxanthomonas sp.]
MAFPLPAHVSRACAAVVALISVAALVLQYGLVLEATRVAPGPWLGTVRFFSYFTILSNLGVAWVTANAAWGRSGTWTRPRWRGLVGLCIGVTGLVYVTVLQGLWQPQGWQWWADISLHYASPVLYLAWWLLGTSHGQLGMRDLLAWLWFPLVYLGWVLLRGAWVAEYPYPFLDLTAHRAMDVARNCVLVTLAFVLVGAVLLGLDRILPGGRR